jgi:hypothetical protein
MNRTTKNTALSGKPQPPITPDESTVSTSSNATTPSSDQVANNAVDTEESFGRISIEDNQLNYVGQSHWAAILDNVSEILDHAADSSADFNRFLS